MADSAMMAGVPVDSAGEAVAAAMAAEAADVETVVATAADQAASLTTCPILRASKNSAICKFFQRPVNQ